MMDKIKCPNCAHEFDVEEALSGKLEAHFKEEYERKVSEQAAKFNAEREVLAKEMEAFEQKKEKENELFKERLAKQIEKEKEVIQKSTQENFEQQLKALADENEKKKEENRQLRAAEINLLKRENELKEKAEELGPLSDTFWNQELNFHFVLPCENISLSITYYIRGLIETKESNF